MTVCPARSRSATAATTAGNLRRRARSIGMIFMSRTTGPRAGQSTRSARATYEPGSTVPIVKMSSQDT